MASTGKSSDENNQAVLPVDTEIIIEPEKAEEELPSLLTPLIAISAGLAALNFLT